MPIKLTTTGPEMDAGQFATQTTGAIAAKGGGKSYLAGVAAEQLAAAGVPFIVIDPIGNWCFLRLAADGKSPGLKVAVVGGEHGDVPLTADQGAALATFLVQRDGSAVVDVSAFSKTKRKEFVADFCEALFRTARTYRTPRTVIFEEAQVFAPQHAARGEERMLGAVTDIVRLGRNYGIGCILVTQRPQSVSKEVLNQIELLFVGGLRGPHERKAIAGWVTEQGADLTEQMAELPTLPPGEFLMWSPSWLKFFGRVRAAKKWTFDGSSTPTLSAGVAVSAIAGTVDTDALRALLEPPGEPELGATVKPLAETLGRSPTLSELTIDQGGAALAELDDLRTELTDLQAENERLADEQGQAVDALRSVVREYEEAAARVALVADEMRAALARVTETVGREVPAVEHHSPPVATLLPGEKITFPKPRPPAPPVAQPKKQANGSAAPSTVGEYEEELLACIAAYGPVTRNRLSILSGKSKASSTFADGIRTLVRAGLVMEGASVLPGLLPTEAGKKRARAPTTPRGRAVLDRLRRSLGEYDTATLDVLVANRRAGVNRKQIAQATGHSIASSTFADSIRRLKKLGLADEAGGTITPSEDARYAMGL